MPTLWLIWRRKEMECNSFPETSVSIINNRHPHISFNTYFLTKFCVSIWKALNVYLLRHSGSKRLLTTHEDHPDSGAGYVFVVDFKLVVCWCLKWNFSIITLWFTCLRAYSFADISENKFNIYSPQVTLVRAGSNARHNDGLKMVG